MASQGSRRAELARLLRQRDDEHDEQSAQIANQLENDDPERTTRSLGAAVRELLTFKRAFPPEMAFACRQDLVAMLEKKPHQAVTRLLAVDPALRRSTRELFESMPALSRVLGSALKSKARRLGRESIILIVLLLIVFRFGVRLVSNPRLRCLFTQPASASQSDADSRLVEALGLGLRLRAQTPQSNLAGRPGAPPVAREVRALGLAKANGLQGLEAWVLLVAYQGVNDRLRKDDFGLSDRDEVAPGDSDAIELVCLDSDGLPTSRCESMGRAAILFYVSPGFSPRSLAIEGRLVTSLPSADALSELSSQARARLRF